MGVVSNIVLVCPMGSEPEDRVATLNRHLVERYSYPKLVDVAEHAGGREPENRIYVCGVRMFDRDWFRDVFLQIRWHDADNVVLVISDSDAQTPAMVILGRE